MGKSSFAGEKKMGKTILGKTMLCSGEALLCWCTDAQQFCLMAASTLLLTRCWPSCSKKQRKPCSDGLHGTGMQSAVAV